GSEALLREWHKGEHLQPIPPPTPNGFHKLLTRGDEVEAAWDWTDPIIDGWEARGDRPESYDSGSAGPEDSLALMHQDGRRWREIRS
ncbi:MAG: hypothetical protein VX181_10235, partial [Pseudomonadota bacterium]|nr:hypothetical protein [Pseudomonadota bacterium]